MAELGSKIGSAYFEVLAATAGFGDSLQAGVTNAITARAAILGDAMEKLGKAMFTRFTLPLAVATAANLTQFTALERGIAETLTLFNTAPSLVDKTFGTMEKGIRDVSEAVGGLERNIADGLYQTISAGVPRGDAFEFLDVAQMAAIADKTADLTTSVDGLTTGIRAFNKDWSETGDVADAFFATVAKGKTTFGELANDIGRVAPLAANAGSTLEETLSIIGQLTVQGLKTSESVSFLRAAITGLLRPGEEMNSVFQAIGFSSAEAAVPVLGLQGAFQAVVDAAGGSTSKLQELIGTSEGVTAILGVTGDNAESFAKILSAVENSAGATSAAFDIVDGTVSRSFGRMTEAFDRLGNLFGGMAAKFAQPVVDTVTKIVNNAIDIFEDLVPIVSNVSELFVKLMTVFDNPIVGMIVSEFAALVLILGGMLGITGALLIPLGKLLIVISQLAASKIIFKNLGTQLLGVRRMILRLGVAMVDYAQGMKAGNVITKIFQGTIEFFGRTMKITALKVAAFSALLFGVIVAVYAAVKAWSAWRDAQKAAYDAIQINTIGVDTLSESLGIAGQKIKLVGDLFAEEGVSSSEAFFAANGVLIGQIDEMQAKFGNLAAKNLILSIGAQLQIEGATPEEAFAAVQKLGNATEVVIGLSFEDFAKEGNILTDVFNGAEISVAKLQAEIDRFGPSIKGGEDLLGDAPAQVNDLAAGLSEALIYAINIGETDVFFNLARDALSGLENTRAQADLFKTMLYNIEEITGKDLGVSISNTTDLDSFILELQNAGFTMTELQKLAEAGVDLNVEPAIFKDLTGGLASDIEKYGVQVSKVIPGVVQLTSEQISVLQTLKSNIGDVLQAGEDVITTTFTNIREGLLSQMPLLGVYQGAVKIAFAEWKTGQDAFQADIAATTILRDKIKDELGDELLAIFDQAAITDKVWLTKLGEKELATALEEMKETLGAVNDSAADIFEQELPDTLDRAQIAMQTKYDEMITAAGDAGTGVAELWKINFERQSATWVGVASTAISEITSILNTTIPGPTVGSVTFGNSGFSQTEPRSTGSERSGPTVIINNPTTSDINRDAQRAGTIIGGNIP